MSRERTNAERNTEAMLERLLIADDPDGNYRVNVVDGLFAIANAINNLARTHAEFSAEMGTSIIKGICPKRDA